MNPVLLLATAMVLAPVNAMASSNQPTPRPRDLGPVAQVTPPCTSLNPCAVPPPALQAPPSVLAEIWGRRGGNASPRAPRVR
jgi:hypothetical protein